MTLQTDIARFENWQASLNRADLDRETLAPVYRGPIDPECSDPDCPECLGIKNSGDPDDPEPECSTCATIRDKYNGFGPSHVASAGCESGKHAHCTCDACF